MTSDMRPIGRFIFSCSIYLFDTMFTAQTAPATTTAGAISTDDMNAYQVGGGVLLIGTAAGCTLGGMLVAPLPVIGATAVGAGLCLFGDRIPAMGKDEAPKTEAKAEAPAKPAPGTAVTV